MNFMGRLAKPSHFGFFESESVDSRLPDCANPEAPAIAVPANPMPDAHFAESSWPEDLNMTVTPMIPPIMAIKTGVKELINSGVIDFMVGNPLRQVCEIFQNWSVGLTQ
jgi:hypothetical protein